MPFALKMPKLSPTMEEGAIAKWHKKEGDFVASGEVLLEINTDKATVEHSALDEGWLRKILVADGASAQINQPIAIFTEKKDEDFADFVKTLTQKTTLEKPKTAPTIVPNTRSESHLEPFFTPEPPLKEYDFSTLSKEPTQRVKASPLARKIAMEKKLDLSSVKGSGPEGRVTSEDLEQAALESIVSFGTPQLPTHIPGTYEEIALSPMRKVVAKRLQESKSFIPHFYLKQTIDATRLWDQYQQLKTLKLKITVNDLIVRACALSLRKHKGINAGFNSQNQTIIEFKTIDIAVAVTLPEGLITPIIRHADYKNLGQISSEIRTLAERAKKGKLKEEEYKGGSFTVSNLGMYGIDEFSAVINPPQAAILAVGGVLDRAVVKEGNLVAGKTLSVVLSCDHRVIDGATGAHFLADLKELLENPTALTI